MAKKKLKVDLIPAIRRLEVVSKDLITNKVIGGYRSVFKGRGLEFSDYRPYSQEDDASRIDWKASARSNQILVKQYVEERGLTVFFLVDASSNMLFGSTSKLKVEYMVELVASLTYAILEAGDTVGLALYTDKPIEKLYPTKGRQQFYIASKTLSDPNMYGGNFDFNKAADFCLSYLNEGAVLIIVSDFISLKENWDNHLKLISSKFDVIGIMIRDPIDTIMPEDSGQVVIQDPYTGKTLLIEPGLIRHAYEKVMKEQEISIRDKFSKTNADFIGLVTDKPFVNSIINLFKRRALKWR